MSLHYFDTKTIRLKIQELQLYRRVFLPWRLDQRLFQRLRLTTGINRRIARFKFRLAIRLKKDKKYGRLLTYLLKSSLANFSVVFLSGDYCSARQERRDRHAPGNSRRDNSSLRS